MESTIADAIDVIAASATTEDIATIREILKDREAVLVRKMANTLRPGAKGRTGGNLRPQYLLGLEVTVVALRSRGTRVDVRLDDTSLASVYPRFIRADGTLPGLPISCFIPA